MGIMAVFKVGSRVSSNHASNILALAILAVVLFGCSTSSIVSASGFSRVHVYIHNDFTDQNLQPLSVHCKSRDDDLGERKLTISQYYHITFRPNIWGTTKFWCDMSWMDTTKNPPALVQGTFDIYINGREYGICNDECNWSVRQDGLYEFKTKTSKKYELVYPWPASS
ncbi:Plant self-incompatibility S1 [Macleaya cordata]|uniref:S-protein homolog n=1 Tax=Macleaya cordata TaxID=56857 RepID=A0A200QJV4_MACCD|nr:Plant self-incompatibility S1 [Macleaya cordata]